MARLSYIVLSTACCDAATLAVLLTAALVVVVEVRAAAVAVTAVAVAAVAVAVGLALLGIFSGGST